VTGEDESETRGWYEQLLDEAAGRRVATGPLFLIWVPILLTALGLAYLIGARGGAQIMPVGAVVSGIYWFTAVPWWLKRHRS
jgi:hypothetical protein